MADQYDFDLSVLNAPQHATTAVVLHGASRQPSYAAKMTEEEVEEMLEVADPANEGHVNYEGDVTLHA